MKSDCSWHVGKKANYWFTSLLKPHGFLWQHCKQIHVLLFRYILEKVAEKVTAPQVLNCTSCYQQESQGLPVLNSVGLQLTRNNRKCQAPLINDISPLKTSSINWSAHSQAQPSFLCTVINLVISWRSVSYHVALLRLGGTIHSDAIGWWRQLWCVWLDEAPSVNETSQRETERRYRRCVWAFIHKYYIPNGFTQ